VTEDTHEDRLGAVRARRSKVGGFEHKHFKDANFQKEGLAELDHEGHWLTWDMRIPLSNEACEFIAAAPADIDWLLEQLTEARSAAQIAEERYAALAETTMLTEKDREDVDYIVDVWSRVPVANRNVSTLSRSLDELIAIFKRISVPSSDSGQRGGGDG